MRPPHFLIGQGEKLWLAPLLLPLAMPLLSIGRKKSDPVYAKILILAVPLGFGWLIAQGFGIGIRGFNFEWLKALIRRLRRPPVRHGLWRAAGGVGVSVPVHPGIAARGAINGDVFVVSAIGGVIVIVTTFVFFPIAKMLLAAFITEEGGYSVAVFASKFFDDRLWGLVA